MSALTQLAEKVEAGTATRSDFDAAHDALKATALEIWKLANMHDPDDPQFLSAIAALIRPIDPSPTEYDRKVAQMREDFPNGI
jgi:hypothetical protein